MADDLLISGNLLSSETEAATETEAETQRATETQRETETPAAEEALRQPGDQRELDGLGSRGRSPASLTPPADVVAARDRAVDHLLRLQHPDGYWKGELETNVTMDAEDLLVREFLGIRDAAQTEAAARWIRSRQRDDGSWATFYGGPADLSTTIEAYVALRLAGDPPEAPHLQAAVRTIRQLGGLERARVFTHLWLALFGLWSWDDVPGLPVELILLPASVPLNVYDFACWARQTIVPLTIVAAHRPCRPLPFGVDELRTGLCRASKPGRGAPAMLARLDRLLRRYQHHPIAPLRRLALHRAERWVVERQEADGSWGGIQPPWVWSLLALHLQGYGLDHPAMARGLRGLDGFTVDPEGHRRLEACQSPVWDTALAVVALRDAGVPSDHPALRRATDWLLGEEIRVGGDWSVRRPRLAPGGWAFEFANVNYPDVDDTAEVVLALRRVGEAGDVTDDVEGSEDPEAAGDAADAASDRAQRIGGAVARAVRWTLGMVSRDGGWGAFDVDNTQRLCTQLPFCDFGEVIDPPSADVTAHMVEMLAPELGRHHPAVTAGVEWLLANQERDGSWFGRWGVNHVYGTGACVPALVAAGVAPDAPPVQAALRWLERVQATDGGWGEDIRSYRDPSWRGRGATTASQTAWALLALLAADAAYGPAASRGVQWLVEHQRADGTWDEPWFTGTGFPGDFSINYHLYRLIFPVTALGRYVDALEGGRR